MRRCPTYIVVLLVTFLIVTAPIASAIATSTTGAHTDTTRQHTASVDHGPPADGPQPESAAATSQNNSTESEPDSPEPPSGSKSNNPALSSSLETLVDDTPSAGEADGMQGKETVTVIVEAEPNGTEAAKRAVSNAGGSVQSTHRSLVQATVPLAALEALANSKGVAYVRKPNRPDTNAVEGQGSVVSSSGLADLNVSGLHDEGIRGDNATVVVIDGGFNVSNPEIRDNVVDYRDMDGTWTNTSGHGTKVTELVVDTAPNASVILIEVDTSVELYNALDHIEQNTSADVVTMSMSWYGIGPLNGESYLDGRIEQQVDSGITWVTSAGNNGNKDHWNGTWQDGDANDWYNWTSSDELNHVGNGTHINLVLNWDDWDNRYEDYDLYLYNKSGSIVASSTDLQDGAYEPDEEISYTNTRNEHLYVAIHRHDANGTADFDLWFRGGSSPQYWTSTRSVTAPATEESIIAVGAMHTDYDTLESFSSRGPTIDGRQRPTLVAPDAVETSTTSAFYGTSASTPYTAGVIALLHDKNESSTPVQKKNALTETAYAVQGDEPNNQTGAGHVDAYEAASALDTVALTPCTIVDTSGTITLNDSFTSANPCIQVNASDVVIEGNQSTLDGSSVTVADGIVVTDGLTNVTIRNLTVRDYEKGVRLQNASDVTLANVSLRNNEQSVRTKRSSLVTVEDSEFSPVDYGFYATNTTDSLVENTTVNATHTPYYGYLLLSSDNLTVRNASAQNQYWGSVLLSNTTNSTVRNLDAGDSSIAVYGYADDGSNVIENVTAKNTTTLVQSYAPDAPTTAHNISTSSGEFDVTAYNVSADRATSYPTTPTNATLFTSVVNVSGFGADGYVNVSATYGASPPVSEDSIVGFVDNGSVWERGPGQTVTDRSNNTLWVNATSGQTIAIMGGPPEINATPTSVDYGDVDINTNATTTVTVENQGASPLNVTETDISGVDAGNFTLENSQTDTILSPFETVDLTVAFDPKETGTYDATLNVSSNDTEPSPLSVPLTGTGVEKPSISVDPASIDYGKVRQTTSGRRNVTVSNDGSAPLNLTGAATSGYSHFTVVTDSNAVLGPGEQTNVTVEFAPPSSTLTSTRTGTLHVYSNDTTANVTLSGTDTRPRVSVMPVAVLSNLVDAGQSESVNVTIVNTGTGTLTVNAVKLDTNQSDAFTLDAPNGELTLAAGESHNATLTFHPDAKGTYEADVLIEHDGIDQSTQSSQFVYNAGPASKSSDGGGGGGGGAVLAPQTNVEPGDDGVDVDIDGVAIGSDVNVRLVGKPTGELAEGVTLRDIEFASRADLGSVEMSVSTSTSPPSAVPAPGETVAVTYVEIDHPDFGNDDIRAPTITFRLSKALLEERGVEPADATVYRYTDGAWEAQDTAHVGAEYGKYVIEASVDGFSTFALGLDGATVPEDETSGVVVTEADTNVSGLYVGDAVAITATVTNDGDSSATATLPITVDGEQVDATEVTLEPGESAAVTFTRRFTEPGTYSLAVDGVEAGTVRVEAENESAGDPDDSTNNESDDTSADESTTTTADSPGFGLVSGLVALLLVARGLKRREP